MEFNGKEFYVNEYHFKFFKRRLWLNLFSHDCMDGKNNFENKSEALSCNKEGKYSILSELNQSFKIKGKYEFLLEYPELKIYNIWRQTNRPIDEPEIGNSYVEGFQPLTTLAPYHRWGGLCLTNDTSPYSLLNGTPISVGNGGYFFAIGLYKTSSWNHGLIPTNDKPVSVVKLWVKFPVLFELMSCNVNRKSNFYLSLTFCMIVS